MKNYLDRVQKIDSRIDSVTESRINSRSVLGINVKKIAGLFLLCLMMMALLPTTYTNVSAAGKKQINVWYKTSNNKTSNYKTSNQKAKKAFEAYLDCKENLKKWQKNTKKSDLSYMTIDLGKNKIPTMIVHNKKASHGAGYYKVFQYRDGKVKEVLTAERISAIYLDAGIIAVRYMGGGYGEEYTVFHQLGKAKLAKKTEVAESAILDASEYPDDQEFFSYLRSCFGKDQYRVNGKVVKKAEFKKWKEKNLTGSQLVGVQSKLNKVK